VFYTDIVIELSPIIVLSCFFLFCTLSRAVKTVFSLKLLDALHLVNIGVVAAADLTYVSTTV